MQSDNPYHAGELAVQRINGVQQQAARLAKMIQPTIPEAAFKFLRQQTMLWVAVEEKDNKVRAFPVTGLPQFLNPHRGEKLEVCFSAHHPVNEIWRQSLAMNKTIGCIALEFSSRRRIRINGVIKKLSDTSMTIEVKQAYTNCPKYIRNRVLLGDFSRNNYSLHSEGASFNVDLSAIIQRIDTAFIGSIGPNGADMSHRGGIAGFIKYKDNVLFVPDYKGNNMYSTLGNFKLQPNASLFMVDFEKNTAIQVNGKPQLLFGSKVEDCGIGGADRCWCMNIESWSRYDITSTANWEELEYSPFNPT